MNVALLIGATFLVSMAQSAQTLTVEQTLQYCSEVRDTVDRLACFEGLARAVRGESSPLESASADTAVNEAHEAPPATEEKSIPAMVAAPGTPDSEKDDAKKPKFVIMRADDLEEERQAAAEAAKPNKKRQAYRVTVLKSWRYSATNQQYIAMTNGEIWKQTDSRRGRSIKNGLELTIKPARISGWLLVFDDNRPAMNASLVR